MIPYEALTARVPRARRDAGGGAAAQDHHPRRRGGRRRHRILVASATAWCTTRCSSSTCCSATAAWSPAPPTTSTRISSSAFPNSYGTLGYALRVKAKTVPVKPYVRLAHLPFRDAGSYFSELEKRLDAGDCRLRRRHGVLARSSCSSRSAASPTRRRTPAITPTRRSTTARSPRSARTTSRSHDYLWRWDTDWFWCSKNVLAQNPLVQAPLRALAAGLEDLYEDHALEQPRGRDEEARARARPAFGVGDPGRRHPDRARRRVPRFLRRRNRPVAAVDLPDRRAR